MSGFNFGLDGARLSVRSKAYNLLARAAASIIIYALNGPLPAQHRMAADLLVRFWERLLSDVCLRVDVVRGGIGLGSTSLFVHALY